MVKGIRCPECESTQTYVKIRTRELVCQSCGRIGLMPGAKDGGVPADGGGGAGPAEAEGFGVRVTEFLNGRRWERRRRSKEHIRGLLDSINRLGCSDAATARLLKVSRSSVSEWRSGAHGPSRERLIRLEYLEKRLAADGERAGGRHTREDAAPLEGEGTLAQQGEGHGPKS